MHGKTTPHIQKLVFYQEVETDQKLFLKICIFHGSKLHGFAFELETQVNFPLWHKWATSCGFFHTTLTLNFTDSLVLLYIKWQGCLCWWVPFLLCLPLDTGSFLCYLLFGLGQYCWDGMCCSHIWWA